MKKVVKLGEVIDECESKPSKPGAPVPSMAKNQGGIYARPRPVPANSLPVTSFK